VAGAPAAAFPIHAPGEILKATVILGSLRDRQDYMIFEGLTFAVRCEQPAFATGV
jgi:hypothetical protein